MKCLEIRVNGLPAPQGSKRHVGGGVMVESSKKVKPWRTAVAAATEKVDFPELPYVRVSVWFFMPRPKSHFRTGRFSHLLKAGAPLYPGKYPDLDKLCRSTLDALRMGGAYRDDAQVVKLHAWKLFVDQDEEPGALIRISDAEL
ncbi:RusA family crossover junction endodeoxyribonuclease [Streptomyces paradoxus]|jgi:crossover junction endodeoxyribonuclease RusA|uniref:RusA family crossover junction endodeoxyribonuclease n=1 Tax=Streptomyces paradoxus TaxID=66375 RepID=UPI0037D03BC6